MTIEQAKNNIGNRVTYIPYEGCDVSQYEFGIITSVNDSYVFVRYGSNLHSQATNPCDLRLG